MTTPTTIDDYPIEHNVSWAEAQQILDRHIKDSDSIVSTAQVLVTKPKLPDFDKIFSYKINHHHWGEFSQPPNYRKMAFRFFLRSALIQGIDPDNAFECMSIKLKDVKTNSSVEKKRTKIIALIEEIHSLTRLLEEINAKILQYRKG